MSTCMVLHTFCMEMERLQLVPVCIIICALEVEAQTNSKIKNTTGCKYYFNVDRYSVWLGSV